MLVGRRLAPSVLLLALLGLFIVPSARAQRPIESANEILPGCRAFLMISQGSAAVGELGQIRGGVCAGKVSALLNVADMFEPKFRFCKPEGVTVGQAIQVILKRLEGNPEVWHQLFDTLALAVFVDVWPCQ